MSGVRRAARASTPRLPIGSARRRANHAERSPLFGWLVRSGFVARGVTYGIVGVLAAALALGAGTDGTTPNQQGALALVARAPLGKAALVVIAVGLLSYAVWKLIQGVAGHGPEGGGGTSALDRISSIAGGIAYLVFFAIAVRVLTGSAGNASNGPRRAAAGVLGWPGGPWIVGAAGVALIAISLYQVYDALSGGFASDNKTGEMGPDERRTFLVLGRIGLTARALVFALIGYFVLRTAIAFRPGNAVGVDGALARLHHQPLGPWLVGLAAAGLLVFSVYSLFEAGYRRL